jgi:cytochrome c
MKLNICLISVLALAAAATTMTREAPAADVPQIDLAEWTPPSIGSVGDDPLGKLVKYGYALFTDTPNQIGPSAPDPDKRFSRSSLTCQNCHLKAGTQPYAVPLTGVWGQFPQYRGREGEIGTLEERINGCLESVSKLHQGLQSFRSMRRMEASFRNARALRLRFSQSLARRRQRLSHAMVRSTIQRLGKRTNPLA